jgi:hypothetical protein
MHGNWTLRRESSDYIPGIECIDGLPITSSLKMVGFVEFLQLSLKMSLNAKEVIFHLEGKSKLR